MQYKVIACGVFEPYLEKLALDSPNEIETVVLDAGLHSRPNDLRLMLQAEIDEASRRGGFDAVIILYGLCGRGSANLVSRDIPIVIPRAHDCITLFLGSAEAYMRKFHENPGTFYHTLGWIQKKINPKNREASELYHNYHKVGYEEHPDFEDLKARFGEENALHIVAFMERWRQHYSRTIYIDMGFPGEEDYAEFTRGMAEVFGWTHEIVRGDTILLQKVFNGEWDDDRIFVLPPNSRSISSGDDRIFGAVSIDADDSEGTLSEAQVILESEAGIKDASGIGLGIDAGGTYTDVVIYDLGERRVLAKSKALTTYHDLVVGIREALAGLPADLLNQVQVTALSTTLATNSIVEGRGHKVGLISISPWDWFSEQIGHEPCVSLKGSTTITGDITGPLDEDACREAVKYLIEKERCAAIVVAGYAMVRNPAQANRVREIITETADIPVVCAHELSRRLNAVRGAQTAIANAKLLPVIRSLIDSVHKALADFHVAGKLMVVKGDGTPVDESIARARPIETILSGPAASASGARILTGLDDALVLDIGGTTTDCAVLENGRVAVSPDGARIGGRVISVDAVEICTVGLGGDSRIGFTPDRKITVGPSRNIPIAYLAWRYPAVRAFLNSIDVRRCSGAPDASALDILVFGAEYNIELTDREKALVSLVREGPVPAVAAAEKLGAHSHTLLPLANLEACGMIKRSALTPTDLLHAVGSFDRWDAESSRKALEIFAAMYGKPAKEVLEMAQTAVTRRLFEEIVRREVSWENHKIRELPANWDFILSKAFADDEKGLGVHFEMRKPVIAIGAPAQALVPKVADHLRAEIVIPDHADVANAVGAIGSEIVVREEILITPGQTSNYVLHGTGERLEFSELRKATDRAVEISKARARERAIAAGAAAPEITVSKSDKLGSLSDGGSIFLERRVVAVAAGAAFTRPNTDYTNL